MSAKEPRGLPAEVVAEVLAGLRATPKMLPCKLFYDAAGSKLFDRICELKEYYLTRTELALMEDRGGEMAARVGPEVVLVELGTGSGSKTRLLLDRLVRPLAYVPVDLAVEALAETCRDLAVRFPALTVLPLVADFSRQLELPAAVAGRRAVAYFPGSTVGNFAPDDALRLFVRLGAWAEGLLLGFDLKKDPARLHAAYNDAQGVTAAFNLNLLARLNRELGADFDLGSFFHYAPYNPLAGRIEMYLVSRSDQRVKVAGEEISLAAGEAISTEWSGKHTLGEMAALAAGAGWRQAQVWTDEEGLFAVVYFARNV